jgi:acyl dehydratase
MLSERKYTCNDLLRMKGSELGVSQWLTVRQDLIDGFGESTKDDDWLHLDPERAARETGFGGTIAFGFWTLAMLTHFSHEIGMWPRDIAYGLNYGLDRVRWISPVPVGSRIRNRCVLIGFDERGEGQFLIRTSNTIEIEGKERPALLAEWLGLFVRSPG